MNLSTVLSVVLVMLAGPALSAPPAPPAPPGLEIDKLAVLLDLDEYQKQQVQTIFETQREDFEAQREEFKASGTRPDFDEIRAQHEAARESMKASLAEVLTPEQMEKLEILSADRRGKRGPHRDGDHRARMDREVEPAEQTIAE